MKKSFLVIIIILLSSTAGQAQAKVRMRTEDKVRIKEAMTISKLFGDRIWNGISEVPFVIILVTDSVEFLINHPYPSNDFTLLGSDSLLQTKIYFRKTQYKKHFLATFPAVNGVNCIVVGTPENTNKNSTDWIITLLHEHFHQYEYSYPDYYKSVNELGLSGGDETGMWMLNYPFPYDSNAVSAQYTKYVSALSKTLASIDTKDFQNNFSKYKTERNKLKKILKPSDYRYFSFQIWQEGIARYTEYKFLELMKGYQASAEVTELPDFSSFAKYKDELYKTQANLLFKLQLKDDKRVCFYAIGFAEGLLLDKLNPNWHNSFLTDKFYIEHYSAEYK